jgi:glycosyltransferase involved in cell wall biosynthesis
MAVADALGRTNPDLIGAYVLNPQLPTPGSLEPLTHGRKLQFSDRLDASGLTAYHVGSPIELEVPVGDLWPPAARHGGLRLIATVFDLIPHLFPEIYLNDPIARRKYYARLALVRRADRILAISEATARDVIDHLRIGDDRVEIVGTGVSPMFHRPKDRRAVSRLLGERLRELEPGYILYTGGIEPRKNIDRLMRAYAALPEHLRRRHQLVIVCRVSPNELELLGGRLRELRIADRVLLTGFVPDEDLVLLYQAAELFVFPSLYEGFGLPIAEAIACGAPVVAANNSAMKELVQIPAAKFDALNVSSIAAAIERGLTDTSLRSQLSEARLNSRHTWESVADRTAAVYRQFSKKRPRSRANGRRRPRIAFVTPLPPQLSGVADESYRLIESLSRHCDVDAYVDGDAPAVKSPPGVQSRPSHLLPLRDFGLGGYDRIFYCLGNSEFHADALALMRRHAGIVIAHDVRLTSLYAWAAEHASDKNEESFYAKLRSMYGSTLPEEIGADGYVDFWTADRYGIFMAREAIALSEHFLVHSQHAAQLAQLDAARGHEDKIDVIPYGVVEDAGDEANGSSEGVPLVATFGIVSPTKQPQKLVDAWPLVLREFPEAKLAFVGSDGGSGENARLRQRLQSLGISDRVHQTGTVSEPRLRRWVSRASLAVQLRAGSSGETSAVVARCLAAGVPTIVSEIGSAAELPAECAAKVRPDATPEELAQVIVGILSDEERRASLAAAGIDYARKNSFAHVAELIYERYIERRAHCPPMLSR